MSGQELVAISGLSPLAIFADGGVDPILKRIREEAKAEVIDISTTAGRERCASLAYKIARSKTALDDMGKQLVSDWKSKSAKVDAERRKIRDELDALKDEVRRPLTDWENKDKDRIAAHEDALKAIEQAGALSDVEPSIAAVDAAIAVVRRFDNRNWEEFETRAKLAISGANERLMKLHGAVVRREEEKAELERHRKAEAERIQRAHEERLKAEAAEKARKEAEAKAQREAEAAARAAEAERQRIEAEKREAEERAAAEQKRLEAERRAAEEKAEAAERARIDAQKKAEADAKAAAERAEREKQEAIEAERRRAAEEKARIDAETARREADKKHRAKVNGEALTALVAAGLTEEQGKVVVAAIARQEIPHIRISY